MESHHFLSSYTVYNIELNDSLAIWAKKRWNWVRISMENLGSNSGREKNRMTMHIENCYFSCDSGQDKSEWQPVGKVAITVDTERKKSQSV